MWNILEWFMCFYIFSCFRSFNGPFYRGKTGHSNGKSLANHHLEEHNLANGDVSMQGNTGNTFLEGKTNCTEWEITASCGTLCLYIYIWNMRNILECFMFFCFMFYIYQNAGGPVRTMRPDHCGSIHVVIAYSP